jgi:hypothetical protein
MQGIQNWCTWYKAIVCGDFMSESQRLDWLSYVPELEKAISHLPNCIQELACKIGGAIVMEPISSRLGYGVPSVLFNVNVIWICACDSADIAQQADFASYVFSTIDFTACCIALEVKADLSYSFRSYDAGAFEALQDFILELRPSAWESDAAKFAIVMRRILKFIVRGFRWPSPHPCNVQQRSDIDRDRACFSCCAVSDVISMEIPSKEYDQQTDDTVTEASYVQAEIDMRAGRVIAAQKYFEEYEYWIEHFGYNQ